MFCVLYKFTVKTDSESPFRDNWVAVTQWLYRHGGSLGSRLHRASDGSYIGYAQWPSYEKWKEDRGDAELKSYIQAMLDNCEGVEVLYELDVTDDLLQREGYRG